MAVEVGMALAALLYIYRVSETTTVSVVTDDYIERGRAHILQDKAVPDYVSILRIHGPFLFGTTDKLAEETRDLSKIHADRGVAAAQHDGDRRDRSARARDAGRAAEEIGTDAAFCAAPRISRSAMLHRAEFVEHIGDDNILPDVNAALERAAADSSQEREAAPEFAISIEQQRLLRVQAVFGLSRTRPRPAIRSLRR